MRVVIEQSHSARRELAVLGLILLFAVVTVAVLLMPQMIG